MDIGLHFIIVFYFHLPDMYFYIAEPVSHELCNNFGLNGKLRRLSAVSVTKKPGRRQKEGTSTQNWDHAGLVWHRNRPKAGNGTKMENRMEDRPSWTGAKMAKNVGALPPPKPQTQF